MVFRFLPIDNSNLEELNNFLSELGNGGKSFRYFDRRPINIVLSHLVAALLINDIGQPVAYGHLESHENTVWLGIAVTEHAQGNGLGKKMMQYLIDQARLKNIDVISLTVDKGNTAAIRLYEKFRFIMEEETDGYYKYIFSNV